MRTIKRLLVINLAEEIHDYVEDLPESEWDKSEDLLEHGTPEELARNAASTYFGSFEYASNYFAEDENVLYAECQEEPADEFYFSVLHSLNNYVGQFRTLGLCHLTDLTFRYPNLVLELSNQKDMVKHHAKLQPPRG